MAMRMSGSHQLRLPRRMSSKVLEGDENVLATRCHWVRAGCACFDEMLVHGLASGFATAGKSERESMRF